MDTDWNGFEWINADDADRSIFSFVRKAPVAENDAEKGTMVEKVSKSGKLKKVKANKPVNLLFVCNFTPVFRPDYRVGVPELKNYTLIMDENGLLEKKQKFKAVESECDKRPYSFDYPLPAYGVAVFTY